MCGWGGGSEHNHDKQFQLQPSDHLDLLRYHCAHHCVSLTRCLTLPHLQLLLLSLPLSHFAMSINVTDAGGQSYNIAGCRTIGALKVTRARTQHAAHLMARSLCARTAHSGIAS